MTHYVFCCILDLNETLNTASETLQSAIASWDSVREDISNLGTEVSALKALAEGEHNA